VGGGRRCLVRVVAWWSVTPWFGCAGGVGWGRWSCLRGGGPGSGLRRVLGWAWGVRGGVEASCPHRAGWGGVWAGRGFGDAAGMVARVAGVWVGQKTSQRLVPPYGWAGASQ